MYTSNYGLALVAVSCVVAISVFWEYLQVVEGLLHGTDQDVYNYDL